MHMNFEQKLSNQIFINNFYSCLDVVMFILPIIEQSPLMIGDSINLEYYIHDCSIPVHVFH